MTARLALAAAIAATAFVAAQTAQTSAARDAATQVVKDATAPAACVSALQLFVAKRQAELRPSTGITLEIINQVTAEQVAFAKTCAAKFDLATTPAGDLAGLSELYRMSRDPGPAKSALDKALAAKTLTGAARATTLASAIRSILGEPKGDERNARLEQLVDELDRTEGATFDQKFGAHQSMEGYYRGDDIDAGIIKHADWLIAASKSFTSEQRATRNYPSILASAYVNKAEALAGQGMTKDALVLLHEGQGLWGSTQGLDENYFKPEIARLELVGTKGGAITAPRWLNVPAGTSSLTMTGSVTLLEFTAHWCGPCRESYPGLNRLRAKYGAQGFRVVMATQLYGYFGSERPLTPEAEVDRDTTYFKEHELNVPVAIADQPAPTVRKPDGTIDRHVNPNDDAYRVGGIPQIQIIDRKGVVRLIMVGYDDANEPKLAAFIQQLLREK